MPWRANHRFLAALAGVAAVLVLAAPVRAQPASATSPAGDAARPRIGLVLSGGGARGLAHIGVLKVLERAHIPIDVIAGTSMGAVVGGLYASGLAADALEREFLAVDWDSAFASRVPRQSLPLRRKDEDFEISPALEIGLRDGQLRLPPGPVATRGLELLLRRYTVPVGHVTQFDRLPIPFRAIATDLETGQAVILDSGDLATALRSSMSIPGLFAPTELHGRVLGDGGLVDNLPVDVARALGADIVIAVNVGTPLAKRDTLGSALGVATQMINILTEQNVQRSLASLGERDLLIAPELRELTAGDFARGRELIDIGQAQAERQLERLAPLALDAEAYAAQRLARLARGRVDARVAGVRFEGTEFSHPQRFAAQLATQAGQTFELERVERDLRALAATGDYLRADARLERDPTTPGDTTVVFDLEEKPWGPHYLRIGLDLETNFAGVGEFNIRLSHNRHWLDANGSEWRNRLSIGSQPAWATEWYHPLNWTLGLWNDWFVAPSFSLDRRIVSQYPQGTSRADLAEVRESARFARSTARSGIDLGQSWGEVGELRLGWVEQRWHNQPQIVAATDPAAGNPASRRWSESGLRWKLVLDRLDFANFPTHGWRASLEQVFGSRRGPSGDGSTPTRERFSRVEGEVTGVASAGPHTLNAHARGVHADQRTRDGLGRYTLGGFQNLSGYLPGQIEGNYLLYGRLAYYYRFAQAPVLTRGLFAGATLEAGNAWATRSELKLGDLRHGMSAFLGADTGLGPLHLAFTWAPLGGPGVYLLLGRP